jgi:hypothetical protein
VIRGAIPLGCGAKFASQWNRVLLALRLICNGRQFSAVWTIILPLRRPTDGGPFDMTGHLVILQIGHLGKSEYDGIVETFSTPVAG